MEDVIFLSPQQKELVDMAFSFILIGIYVTGFFLASLRVNTLRGKRKLHGEIHGVIYEFFWPIAMWFPFILNRDRYCNFINSWRARNKRFFVLKVNIVTWSFDVEFRVWVTWFKIQFDHSDHTSELMVFNYGFKTEKVK